MLDRKYQLISFFKKSTSIGQIFKGIFSRTRIQLFQDHDIHYIKDFVTFCLCYAFSLVYSYMYKYNITESKDMVMVRNFPNLNTTDFCFIFESFPIFAMLPSHLCSLPLHMLPK